MPTDHVEEANEEDTKVKGNEQAATEVSQPNQKVRQTNPIFGQKILLTWHCFQEPSEVTRLWDLVKEKAQIQEKSGREMIDQETYLKRKIQEKSAR